MFVLTISLNNLTNESSRFQLGTELGYAQTVSLQLSKLLHYISITKCLVQVGLGKSAVKILNRNI